MSGSGEPPNQSKSSATSLRHSVGVPLRLSLFQYSPFQSVIVGHGAMKFAVTDLLTLIVMLVGLDVPFASPLQLLKTKPLLTLAVNCTTVPAKYWVALLQFD